LKDAEIIIEIAPKTAVSLHI